MSDRGETALSVIRTCAERVSGRSAVVTRRVGAERATTALSDDGCWMVVATTPRCNSCWWKSRGIRKRVFRVLHTQTHLG